MTFIYRGNKWVFDWKPLSSWRLGKVFRNWQRLVCSWCWSTLTKKAFLRQIGICWKRYRNFGRITILIRLTRPARDKGMIAHLYKSDLHLSNNFWKFFRKRSLKDLVINTPKYWNPSSVILKGNVDCGSDLAKLLTKNSSLFECSICTLIGAQTDVELTKLGGVRKKS